MEQENNKIYWVKGNTQPLLIPLEQEVMTPNEEIVREPYYPDEGAVVKVILESTFRRFEYTPTVNGNLLTFTDAGTLPCGCYDVVVKVDNPNGTHFRSKWNHQIVVTDDNVRTLQEWDEFKDQEVEARAAVFFFAKGDPFTYEDFTPEEIEGLQKPARDAAAEINEDYAQVKRDAQAATGAANDAAQLANEKAGLANEKAGLAAEKAALANEKAGYAQDKGDYAKQKGDYAQEQGDAATAAINEAKGDYDTLGGRLGAMQSDIDNRLTSITETELDEIFPLNS